MGPFGDGPFGVGPAGAIVGPQDVAGFIVEEDMVVSLPLELVQISEEGRHVWHGIEESR
jgi:hypothetical protein